jgi:hypothetical protein
MPRTRDMMIKMIGILCAAKIFHGKVMAETIAAMKYQGLNW